MVDTKSHKTLENFANGIIKLDEAIKVENPDILIYPIAGAIPIADLLRIVNPQIDSYCSEYMPASSRIIDRSELIYHWFTNLLNRSHVRGEPQKFVTIDEVVSGSSVTKTSKQVRKAVSDLANNRSINSQEIGYKSLALEDLRYQKEGKHLSNTYLKLLDRGIVSPIQVDANLVMDKPSLCPLKLIRIPNDRYGRCLPVMKEYIIGSNYLEFLSQFANIIGQDLTNINLQNAARIRHSERFLPEKYKSLDNYLRHK